MINNNDVICMLKKLKNLAEHSRDFSCERLRVIIEIINDAIEHNKRNEYYSISDALRIFLEISSDYQSELYQELYSVDNAIVTRYNEMLFAFYKNNSALSDKRIEKCIRNLRVHRDLYKELIEFILKGEDFSGMVLVNIEGYNVKKLINSYPLTIAGAYNYLMYLREDPQNALKELKKSLPRK